MTERNEENVYPFASINDECKVRNTVKRIARGFCLNKTIVRQVERRIFSPNLATSTLDRNTQHLWRIRSPRYQVNSRMVNARTFKAMPRKEIQHNCFTEVAGDFRMS